MFSLLVVLINDTDFGIACQILFTKFFLNSADYFPSVASTSSFLQLVLLTNLTTLFRLTANKKLDRNFKNIRVTGDAS